MNVLIRIVHATAVFALVASSPSLFAQQAFLSYDVPSAASSHTIAAGLPVTPAPALTDHWLDLKTLEYAARYRATKNWHGRDLFDFGQDKYVAEGRIKLDSNAKYTIDFHASTGRYFNWSYADLIGGQYKDSVVRILVQLNRGEGRHQLARIVFHGKRGELRQRYREGQEDQLGALGIVVNLVVLWNTIYMDAALNQLRAQGHEVLPEDIARLSPLSFKHINMLGRYAFTLPDAITRGELRPLRNPATAAIDEL